MTRIVGTRFIAPGVEYFRLESFAKVRALKRTMPDLIILPAHDTQSAAKLSQPGVLPHTEELDSGLRHRGAS